MARGNLRVLLTVDSVGGVWQYGLDLACALADHGVETIIAHMGPAPSEAQRQEARLISGATFVETGLPLDWLCDGSGPVRLAGAAIASLAGDANVDIVQLNMPTLAAAAPFPAPVIAVTHGCVATWWEAAWPNEPLPTQFRWHRSLMAQGLGKADLIISPTASYARTIARCYGLIHVPDVVHNGRQFPTTGFPSAMQDSVLTVGRLWDRVKRTTLLDRVAGRLAVPFRAAGAIDAPHGERIALEHLHPLGHVGRDALARCLAQRPVFVSAASFEPFGLAVLEAAAAGCALVLSDIPGFRELWDGAAVFVAGEDDAAWAGAIEQLIGDTANRTRLGEAARRLALRRTHEAMAADMLGIYRRLAAGLGSEAA